MKCLSKIIMFWLAFMLLSNASAQAPDILWTRLYGGLDHDFGQYLKQTSDGGFIVTGGRWVPGNSTDIYLVKTDENGDTIWTRTYGGSYFDEGRLVYETEDNGYLVIGNDRSFGAGETDIVLIKTDALGDVIWDRLYGGAAMDAVVSGQKIPGGGYILIGYTTSFGDGIVNLYLLRLNDSGDTLWTRTYGGDYVNYGGSVIATPDGGFILLGNLDYSGGQGFDLTAIKTDADGDTLWTKSYGESGGEAVSIIPTADGNYLILANSPYDSDEYDIHLIKIDSGGGELWSEVIGDLHIDIGLAIHETADSGFIICGYTGLNYNEDILIVKTGVSGDMVWTKIIAGEDYGYDTGNAIIQLGDGSYVLAGKLSTYGEHQQLCLIKIASDQVGMEDKPIEQLPYGIALYQNYPNPFNVSTTISFFMPDNGFAQLKLYDLLGREVRTLANGQMQPGIHNIIFNASGLTSGIYFYRLGAPGQSDTKKMILMK